MGPYSAQFGAMLGSCVLNEILDKIVGLLKFLAFEVLKELFHDLVIDPRNLRKFICQQMQLQHQKLLLAHKHTIEQVLADACWLASQRRGALAGHWDGLEGNLLLASGIIFLICHATVYGLRINLLAR